MKGIRSIYKSMETLLSRLFCGFQKAHSTQHAFFQLLQSWQSELDKSGSARTIFMDLSKAYDYIAFLLQSLKLIVSMKKSYS